MQPSAQVDPFRVVVKPRASFQLQRLPAGAFVRVRRVLQQVAEGLGRGLHAVEGAVHHLELAGRAPPGCSKVSYAVDPRSRTLFVLDLAR